MKRAVGLCALLAVFCGCGPRNEEISKYEAGDYVVYRYHGSYRKDPVTLRESVLSKDGNKLCILVEWKSGAEARAWKQFVTDTRYNRANNIVDRLVLMENGAEKELPNKDNLDLFRLYEGTFLMAQHSPSLVKEETKIMTVAGRPYRCTVRTTRTKVLGTHADMITAESADFKWTAVSSRYVAAKGKILYEMEVAEAGSENQPGTTL